MASDDFSYLFNEKWKSVSLFKLMPLTHRLILEPGITAIQIITLEVTFDEIENAGKDEIKLNDNNHRDAILIRNFYNDNSSK